MVMIYTMNYIIGGTDEPFRACVVEPYTRQRYISMMLDVKSSEFESGDAFLEYAWQELDKRGEVLEKEEDVVDAKTISRQYVKLNSFIGQMSTPCYLFESAQDCQDYLDHMGAKLVSGRMPEKPGELLMDKLLMANHKNDNDLLTSVGSNYEVVGEVESDYYLSFGIARGAENNVSILALMKPDSDMDLRPVMDKLGFPYGYYQDYETAEKDLTESVGALDVVQTIFTGVSGALLMICVFVVLAIHILDRHNEWCLINSIGFKTGEIYVLALKELLICVVIAFFVGSALSLGGCFVMEKLLYNPIGISIKVFRPQALPRVLTVFAILIGIAQIPIFNGMRKIQTIDAIE